ncbi:MAG: hypothetical protein WKG00_40660 [Polyangiaceae bacterium]
MKDALGGSWSRRALACALGFALSFVGVNACSPSSGDAGEDGSSQASSGTGASGQGGNGSGASSSSGSGSGNATGNGGGINPAGTGGGSGVGGACAAVSSEAKPSIQPADIIIAVDTSGSMDEESAEVQANLNQFATIITNSGIDVHVILIADGSVCIPAPLGAGACNGPPDENLPGYRHVQQTVNSNDGLQVILDTYPQWSASLRPDATRTVAIVSDDNSDLSASDFVSQLVALDPTFQGFKFDAIVASAEPFDCFASCFAACASCANPCCDKAALCVPISAAKGTVYESLVSQTMGVIGDLCEQNFDPVFQSMATGIISGSQVSCALDIPKPDGGMLDPGKVNVKYTPGGNGNPSSIGNVPGGAAACDAQGGWYYDDPVNPTQIILCPATCTVVQSDPDAKVEVLFGCETEIIVPD